VTSVVIDRNEILHNNTDNWEARIEGCGCTGGAKFWDVSGAIVTNNWVKDNLSVGLWADTNNRDFVVEGNWFEGNQDEAFWYEVSYNARIRYNVFVRNTLVKGRDFAQRGDNFPVAAVYLSEAGGDPRVVGPGSIDISFNLFQDNWSAVTLWENAGQHQLRLLHARGRGHPADLRRRHHRTPALLQRLPVEDAERRRAPQRVPGEPCGHRVHQQLVRSPGRAVELRDLPQLVAVPG
jgi:hypothetical protein